MNSLLERQLGTILALVEEFEQHRYPYLMEVKQQMADGKMLREADLQHLAQYVDDAYQALPILWLHPMLHGFCAQMCHLFAEISALALSNESKH